MELASTVATHPKGTMQYGCIGGYHENAQWWILESLRQYRLRAKRKTSARDASGSDDKHYSATLCPSPQHPFNPLDVHGRRGRTFGRLCERRECAMDGDRKPFGALENRDRKATPQENTPRFYRYAAPCSTAAFWRRLLFRVFPL